MKGWTAVTLGRLCVDKGKKTRRKATRTGPISRTTLEEGCSAITQSRHGRELFTDGMWADRGHVHGVRRDGYESAFSCEGHDCISQGNSSMTCFEVGLVKIDVYTPAKKKKKYRV